MDSTNKEFNWKVAGFAGEGIMTTGLLFSKVCARHGLQIFDYTEYPSLIRGGHNTYQVFASNRSALAQRKKVDLLIALNRNALNFHKQELDDDSLVIYDSEDDKIDIQKFDIPGKTFDLPMVRLAQEAGAVRLMANNVALGASIFFLGLNLNILDKIIEDIFSRKGAEIVNLNQNAAKAGWDFAKKQNSPPPQIKRDATKNLLTMTGNEAIGLGAVAGGLQMYVAYPMTPSSSLLHYLAKLSGKANILVKHAEDEISTVNMAIGGSFAGARVMVGTSGGGFAYMTEALGLSGVAELPLVVMEAMRPGPALGMPTWTAQGDLGFILNASQDEFPRFVLTPGDGIEAFNLAKRSLELSEKYQTLVMLVSDKYLSESRHTLTLSEEQFSNPRYGFAESPEPDQSGFFPRYQVTADGLSPRTTPGTTAGTHVANSYEHDIYGLATEVSGIRKAQMDKRFNKLNSMKSEVPEQYFEEMENSEITFISFGSTKGVIRSARSELEKKGIKSNMLHLSWIWPFPADQVQNAISKSEKTIVIEGNRQGQLSRLITQETGENINHNLRKYDGRPFYIEDIVDFAESL